MQQAASVVAKFGGSSVANAEQFLKVANIVKSSPERRFVIVSAPGALNGEPKVTDVLLKLNYFDRCDASNQNLFVQAMNRFRTIAKELKLKIDLESIVDDLRQDFLVGASRDFMLSRGEFLCGRMMAEHLQFKFVDPSMFIRFGHDGFLDMCATTKNAHILTKETGGVVVPGFYGLTPKHEIRVFSRGGSDLTGAIVADLVGAKEYENWTDVCGVLVADPRIVANPKRIKEITFRELRELSYSGANVVHEEAVFPLARKGIPLHVRNTNEPEKEGTRVISTTMCTGVSRRPIVGIAGRKGFVSIRLEKAGMNAEKGFIKQVASVVSDHDLSIEHLPGGIDTMSIVLAQNPYKEVASALYEDFTKVCKVDEVSVLYGVALICVVGKGMVHTPGVMARVASALARRNINIRIVDQGSSEISIILGVDEDDYENAIRAIYDEFTTRRSGLLWWLRKKLRSF